MYPTEYLNMITASGLPLHKLTLKVGSPVMVLHNLNLAEGVCNGTRGIMTCMTNRVLELCLLGDDHDGHLVFLPRIKCYPSNAQIPFQLCYLQFCVRNAFSMSVNKVQGQSLKYVGPDFCSSVFTHGQLYIAVSRATSVNRIKAIWDPKFPNPVTKNYVFPEVLLDYFILCLQGST
jgi:ATP-dependent exoDNAse (exonuclease V) alpha subunit